MSSLAAAPFAKKVLCAGGSEDVYAEVGGEGVDNPGFQVDANTPLNGGVADINQNFYANLSSKVFNCRSSYSKFFLLVFDRVSY